MTFQVKTPDALAEGLKGAVTTDISKSKDNEKQQDEQKTAQEFIFQYLENVVEDSIWKCGCDDDRVNRRNEAHLITLFERYLTGCDGDNISKYVYAENTAYIRIYNGFFFERFEVGTLEYIIKKILKKAQVGNVYVQNSCEKITKEVVKTLLHCGCDWHSDNRYFVFRNGVLDVAEMQLLPFSAQYLTNNIFSINYDANASCTTFRGCLNDALDSTEQAVLQEMCGYLLFPDCRHEIIGVLVGNGRNGKSAILNAVAYALGDANKRVTHYNLQQMTEKKGNCIAQTIGAIANISNESGNLLVGSEAALKSYASGEPIKARNLYQNSFTTTEYPKSIVAVNELPTGSDFSDGFFRRFLIIPFKKQIPLEKVDKQLKFTLQDEQMGILLWIFEGMKRLEENGAFSQCDSVENIADRYRTESDSVASFVIEKQMQPSDKGKRELSQVYSDFKEYLVANGFQSMSSRKFAERLRHLGFNLVRGTGGQMYVSFTFSPKKIQSEQEKLPF